MLFAILFLNYIRTIVRVRDMTHVGNIIVIHVNTFCS